MTFDTQVAECGNSADLDFLPSILQSNPVNGRLKGLDVVFARDVDENVRDACRANYGIIPKEDIVSIQSKEVPDQDLLFSGFPCQPFSNIGRQPNYASPHGKMSTFQYSFSTKLWSKIWTLNTLCRIEYKLESV